MEQVEQKGLSIFQYILEEMGKDSLPEDFSLLRNNGNELKDMVPDGLVDGIRRHHDRDESEETIGQMVDEIENALVLLSNGSFQEADQWFSKIGMDFGMVTVAGIIHEYIEENQDNLYADNVFEGALYLMTESLDAESVKAGMLIMDHFDYEFEIKNIMRILGLCSEFTFYVALNMLDWQNGNGEIFQLAQFVNGWGRIGAMEILEPTNKYIKDWMLTEGINDGVPRDLITKEYHEKIKNVFLSKVTDEYMFCQVVPFGMERAYTYIFPGEKIEEGDIVIVPLGAENNISLGEVVDISFKTKEDAPYPVEKTKAIIRIIDESEMKYIDDNMEDEDNDQWEDWNENKEAHEDHDWHEDKVEDSIIALEEFMEEGKDSQVLDWAISNHERLDEPRLMAMVIKAYEYCVNKKYKLEISALNLGSIYYCGTAVHVDYKKAAEYYMMAAKHGSKTAMCNLGYCYMYGRHQEVDMEKAYKCFNMAGLLGDANALYKLGDMYFHGKHVEVNYDLAFKLYERSFDTFSYDKSELADVQMRLGRCYLEGLGVKKNLDLAMSNLTDAMDGLYGRRKTDPFAKGILETCKGLIKKCQDEMDKEFVSRI